MSLVDTHCHIHDSEFYPDNREESYKVSFDAGVAMVCVGTDVKSSQESISFCASHPACYPVIGIHPHDTKSNEVSDIAAILKGQNGEQVIGIGEIGLDY